MMKTCSLQVSEDLALTEFDLAMIVASKLYEDGRLSAGQAAEVAGVSKRTFIELLGKYGVSVFGDSVEELRGDLANA